MLNVPSKSRAEHRPLGLTVLSSSVSNSGGVSRKQSPDQDVWGAGMQSEMLTVNGDELLESLARKGREKEGDS